MKNFKFLGILLIICLTVGLFPTNRAKAMSEVEVVELSEDKQCIKLSSIPKKEGVFIKDIALSDNMTITFSVPKISDSLKKDLTTNKLGYFMGVLKIKGPEASDDSAHVNLFIYDPNRLDGDIVIYARNGYIRLDSARVAVVNAYANARPSDGVYTMSFGSISDYFYTSGGAEVSGSFTETEFTIDGTGTEDLLCEVKEYNAYNSDKKKVLEGAEDYCNAEGIALDFEAYAKHCGVKSIQTTFERDLSGGYAVKRYFVCKDIVVVLASTDERCICYTYSLGDNMDDPEQFSAVQALDTGKDRVILYSDYLSSLSTSMAYSNYFETILDSSSRLTINWDCFKEFKKLIK